MSTEAFPVGVEPNPVADGRSVRQPDPNGDPQHAQKEDATERPRGSATDGSPGYGGPPPILDCRYCGPAPDAVSPTGLKGCLAGPTQTGRVVA